MSAGGGEETVIAHAVKREWPTIVPPCWIAAGFSASQAVDRLAGGSAIIQPKRLQRQPSITPTAMLFVSITVASVCRPAHHSALDSGELFRPHPLALPIPPAVRCTPHRAGPAVRAWAAGPSQPKALGD